MRFYEIIKEGYKEVNVKFLNDANAEEIKEYFQKFRDLVNRNQIAGDEKNIDWWGNQGWAKFKNFVDEKSSIKTKTQIKRSKIKGDFHVFKDDEDWLIIIPLDKDASCYFGKNTKWCVTKRSQTNFEEYFYESSIILVYFLNKKTGQKWAMADYMTIDRADYFDINDEPISEDKFLKQTGISPEYLEKIDDEIRFGELNKKLLSVIDDYEKDIYKLEEAIANLKVDETSEIIEQKIMELGNIVLLEKYFENFDEPATFSKPFQDFILNTSIINIQYMKKPTLEQQKKAIESNYLNFRYIDNPYPEIQMYYVKNVDEGLDGRFERNVKYKVTDTNAQLELAKRLPFITAGLFRNPSEKVLLTAVSTDGESIIDIKNPSKEVQLAAVKNTPYAIKYIKYPYPEVLELAIQSDPRMIEYIDNPSKEIQKMAVDLYPFVISKIHNADPEIKKYAKELIQK